MAETDISKVVSLIMDNPKLVEEIKELAKGTDGDTETKEAPRETEQHEAEKSDTVIEEEGSTYPYRQGGRKSQRTELLKALKPYVSKERGKAIESMITIAEVLEVMRER